MDKGLRETILKLLSSMQGKEIPQSYIHRALNASKSRVSEILKELERNGLIERRSIGRSKIIYVKKGIAEKIIKHELKTLRLGIVYSSEYLFLGYFIDEMREKGYSVHVEVFKDGLDTTRALAEGEIDLALSPLVSQLYMYPLYKSYRIIAGGMTGGFKILKSPNEGEGIVVYSSRISTMDYIRSEYIEKSGLRGTAKTIYFKYPDLVSSPNRIKGYVILWHPLYHLFRNKGFQDLTSKTGISIGNCCTLAASNIFDSETMELIRKTYLDSINRYIGDPYRYLSYYSAVTGIPVSVLSDAAESYKPSPEVDIQTIRGIVSKLNNGLPDSTIYYEALYTGH